MSKNNFKIDTSYWIYGLVIGLILIVLEIVQYKTLVRGLRFEVAVLIVGVVFTSLGVWLGVRFFNRKQREAQRYSPEDLGLSKRETEVLNLLSQGYSNQEIADQLFVSLNTTKTHLANIYSKLGVSRRTQAVAKARKLTLVKSEKTEITRKNEDVFD